MQDEQWEAQVTDSLRPLMPRAMPNARFVRDLQEDVRRAARQRMDELGIQPAVPFEEMVVELRKLIHLLRKTLIPVSPDRPYVCQVRRKLQEQAGVARALPRQGRRPWQSRRPWSVPQRWLMVGVGSILSLGGLLAALLLRKRGNGDKTK